MTQILNTHDTKNKGYSERDEGQLRLGGWAGCGEGRGGEGSGTETKGSRSRRQSRELALSSHSEEEVGLTRPGAYAVESKTQGHIQERVPGYTEI